MREALNWHAVKVLAGNSPNTGLTLAAISRGETNVIRNGTWGEPKARCHIHFDSFNQGRL